MKVITHEDIVNLKIPTSKCYDWVIEALKNKDKVMLPPKISMKPYDGVFCNVMPSVISHNNKDLAVGGIKFVTRYPNRAPSLDSKILIYDAISGDFKAVMDANWITVMRTGAVAAHSIKLFAKSNYSTIGFVGLGNTARTTLLVFAELEKEKEFTIKLLKYKNQAEDFEKRFQNYKNLKFIQVNTPEELVSNSDVIISAATYMPNDFCSDSHYKEGITVIPVHTLGFTNCDLFFDKVYADDTGHVKHFKYFDKFKKFAQVSDVINGKAKGRESDKERILVYNIGISMHDINYASHIYDLMKDTNCQEIDFKEPAEKFWV